MMRINVDLSTPLSRVMVAPVQCLQADWSLKDAARFFMDHRFSGGPVVDEQGEPVGVLTLKDVVRYTEWHLESEEADDEKPTKLPASEIEDEELSRGYHVDRMTRVTVRQVMTTGVRTLSENATVKDALTLLLKEHFHRVFVVNSRGRIVGIVSTLDLLEWLKEHTL